MQLSRFIVQSYNMLFKFFERVIVKLLKFFDFLNLLKQFKHMNVERSEQKVFVVVKCN